jgi:hypothetical protein
MVEIEVNIVEEKKEQEDHHQIKSPCKKSVVIIDNFQVLTMDDYLDSDPVDNQGDCSFTGVWHSSKSVLQWLLEEYHCQTTNTNTTAPLWNNVLELGAGTGWLGKTLLQNIHYIQQLCLTDSKATGAVQWTQANLDSAKSQGLLHLERASVVPMDWKDSEQIEHAANLHSWDLMIGSDLIYTEEGVGWLAKAMASLLNFSKERRQQRPASRIVYGHTHGRIPELDQKWEQQLHAVGLTWNILERIPVIGWEGRSTVIMEIFCQA